MKLTFWTSVLLLTVVLFPSNASGESRPPEQPLFGPGGAAYRHRTVQKSVYGEAENQYWLFEPANPVPKSAPLVIFLHGWGAVNPKTYGGWIEHIVRKGNIVVYPRYQTGWRYPPEKITGNAAQAVKDAIDQLQSGKHVKPELNKLAVVGHSAGGQTAANLTASAKSFGLPEPKAIMCVEPGKSWNKSERLRIPLKNLSAISSQVLLLSVAGDRDDIASDTDAKRIFRETPQIPYSNKNFVIIISDDHGKPALTASHFAPCAVDEKYDSGEKTEGRKKDGFFRSEKDGFPDINVEKNWSVSTVNALDYYGFWKLFDGLCDAAFYGKNRQYALGKTPEQRFMGKWSDGTPVKELVVTENP